MIHPIISAPHKVPCLYVCIQLVYPWEQKQLHKEKWLPVVLHSLMCMHFSSTNFDTGQIFSMLFPMNGCFLWLWQRYFMPTILRRLLILPYSIFHANYLWYFNCSTTKQVRLSMAHSTKLSILGVPSWLNQTHKSCAQTS